MQKTLFAQVRKTGFIAIRATGNLPCAVWTFLSKRFCVENTFCPISKSYPSPFLGPWSIFSIDSFSTVNQIVRYYLEKKNQQHWFGNREYFYFWSIKDFVVIGSDVLKWKNDVMKVLKEMSYFWNTLQNKYLSVTFRWRIMFWYQTWRMQQMELSECSNRSSKRTMERNTSVGKITVVTTQVITTRRNKNGYRSAFLPCEFWHQVAKMVSTSPLVNHGSTAFTNLHFIVTALEVAYHDHHTSYCMISEQVEICTERWSLSQKVVFLAILSCVWFELPIANDSNLKIVCRFNSWSYR